jgi:hypothetical protein
MASVWYGSDNDSSIKLLAVLFSLKHDHLMGFRTVQYCSQVCTIILSASITVEDRVLQDGLTTQFLDVMHSLKHFISAVIQESQVKLLMVHLTTRVWLLVTVL